MMYDVVVLGEINADLILQGDVIPAWGQAEKLLDDAALILGGSSGITACGLARLGLRVALVGAAGDDPLGRFCMAELAARGVDTSYALIGPQYRTGITVVLQQPHDRAMLTFAGAIADLRADDVSATLLAQTRHVHVGSYFLQAALQPGLAALFAAVRRAGVTTSLDTNWDPSGCWDAVAALLPEVDILLPNDHEAQAIATALVPGSKLNTEAAVAVLAAHVPTVAVKCGAAGAIAVRGAERAAASPPPVQVVDAVGAGDSFNAGLIAGLLQGWSLQRSLELAVVCGACSTRAAGGTAAQPTLEEALSMGMIPA